MKPVLQFTKKNNETEIKMEKKKANDWMCQSQRIPSMIVKRPQTEDKKMLYWYF